MVQSVNFAKSTLRLLCLSSVTAALAGCANGDPLQQPYTWRPLHVYDANIEAQVERKSDLISGRHLGPSDGHEAADAVQRWRDGKVRQIPDTDLAQLQTNGSGSGSGSGGSGN
ncbi:MAG: hypothetical protein ABF636_04540 [Acetobacter sp.]